VYRCESCGNTESFVIDFRETVFGSVVAAWDQKTGWECDWDTRKDEDGTVDYGEWPDRECVMCGSRNIEEYDTEDEEDQSALGLRLLFSPGGRVPVDGGGGAR
jgi:hypothetical protein